MLKLWDQILFVSLFLCVFTGVGLTKKNVVRFAMIAPFGTPWSDAVYQANKDIEKQTHQAISLKIYDSAKMGDEPDYLRKMRSGQLHCALFTGYGFSLINPNVLAMELPFLFESQEEGDWVYDKMTSFFHKQFAAKDLELLGFSTYGKVYFITSKPIQTMKDFKSTKVWVWEGDPIIKSYFSKIQIPAREMPITDVLVGLQTGMIEGVYAPPLAAIGFQWWTKVKYVTTPHFRKGIGGALCTKKKWDTFQPKHQKIIRNIMQGVLGDVNVMVRKGNEDALRTLEKNNIQQIALDEKSDLDLRKLSAEFHQEMVGKIYDQATLSQVEKQIQAYRTKAKK